MTPSHMFRVKDEPQQDRREQDSTLAVEYSRP
jgi:hypothetical protein